MEQSQSVFSLYEPYQNGRVPVLGGAGTELGRPPRGTDGRRECSVQQPSSVAMGTDTESAGSICCTSRQGVGVLGRSQADADVEGPEGAHRRRLGSQTVDSWKGTDIGALLFSPWLEKLKGGGPSSGLHSARERNGAAMSGQHLVKNCGRPRPQKIAFGEVIAESNRTKIQHSQLMPSDEACRARHQQLLQREEPYHAIHSSMYDGSGGSGGQDSGGRHRKFFSTRRTLPKVSSAQHLSCLQSELQTLEEPSSEGRYTRISGPSKGDAAPANEATLLLSKDIRFSQEQIMRDIDAPHHAKEEEAAGLEGGHAEGEPNTRQTSGLCEESRQRGKGTKQHSEKKDAEMQNETSEGDGSGDIADMVAAAPVLGSERPKHPCEDQIIDDKCNSGDTKANVGARMNNREKADLCAGPECSPVVKSMPGVKTPIAGDATATVFRHENVMDMLGKASKPESDNVPLQSFLLMTNRDGRHGAAVEAVGRRIEEGAGRWLGNARKSMLRKLPHIRELNERNLEPLEEGEVSKASLKHVLGFAPFMKLMYAEHSEKLEPPGDVRRSHKDGSYGCCFSPMTMRAPGGDHGGAACLQAGASAPPGGSSSCLHDPDGSSSPSHQKGFGFKSAAGKSSVQFDALPACDGTGQRRNLGNRGVLPPCMGAGQNVGKLSCFTLPDQRRGVRDAMAAGGLPPAQDGPRGVPAICMFQPTARWEASAWAKHQQASRWPAEPQVAGKVEGWGTERDYSSAKSSRQFNSQLEAGTPQFQMGTVESSPYPNSDICKKCKRVKAGKASTGLTPSCKSAGQGASGGASGRNRLQGRRRKSDGLGKGSHRTAGEHQDDMKREGNLAQRVQPDRTMELEGSTEGTAGEAGHDARNEMGRDEDLLHQPKHSGRFCDGWRRSGQPVSGEKGGNSGGRSSPRGLDRGNCQDLLAEPAVRTTDTVSLEAGAKEGRIGRTDNPMPPGMNSLLYGRYPAACGRPDDPVEGAVPMQALSLDAAAVCHHRVDNIAGVAIGGSPNTTMEPSMLPRAAGHGLRTGPPFARKTFTAGSREASQANFLQESIQKMGQQSLRADTGKARITTGSLSWGLMGLLRREQSDEQEPMPPPRFGMFSTPRKDGQCHLGVGSMQSCQGTGCKVANADRLLLPVAGQGPTDGDVHVEHVVIRNGISFVRKQPVRMQITEGKPVREAQFSDVEKTKKRGSIPGFTGLVSEANQPSRRPEVRHPLKTVSNYTDQDISDRAQLMRTLAEGSGKLNVALFEPWAKIAETNEAKEENMGNSGRGGTGHVIISTKTASGSTTASLPLEIFTRFRNASRGGDIRGEAESSHGGSSVCGGGKGEDEGGETVGGMGNMEDVTGHKNSGAARGSDNENSQEGIQPTMMGQENGMDDNWDVCDEMAHQKPRGYRCPLSSHCRNAIAVSESVGQEVGSIRVAEVIHKESLPVFQLLK